MASGPYATGAAEWMGRPDDAALIARAGAVLPHVLQLIRGYTRGRGFPNEDAWECPSDIQVVVYSVIARVLANPDGLQKTTVTGPFTETVAGWQGFTLMERQILDRYRVKAL
nr:hypothetical protein [Propionicimonas sp.]